MNEEIFSTDNTKMIMNREMNGKVPKRIRDFHAAFKNNYFQNDYSSILA
jgi:hypothetical protein